MRNATYAFMMLWWGWVLITTGQALKLDEPLEPQAAAPAGPLAPLAALQGSPERSTHYWHDCRQGLDEVPARISHLYLQSLALKSEATLARIVELASRAELQELELGEVESSLECSMSLLVGLQSVQRANTLNIKLDIPGEVVVRDAVSECVQGVGFPGVHALYCCADGEQCCEDYTVNDKIGLCALYYDLQ